MAFSCNKLVAAHCKWGKILPGSSFGTSAITVAAIKLSYATSVAPPLAVPTVLLCLLSPESDGVAWDVIPKSGGQGEEELEWYMEWWEHGCHGMLITLSVLKKKDWRWLHFWKPLVVIFWRKFEGRWFSCLVLKGGMGKSREGTAATVVIHQNTKSQGWAHCPLILPAPD